ncbi:MAG: hypothetical protein JNM95_15540 [Chitinophagaceae bacterium]|nr:hypothetical protein [Chitinophagaceae bacterium]
MLDLIALIFLTRYIGNIAREKKLDVLTWKLYTVLAWFAGLFVGVSIGMALFGTKNTLELLKPENTKAMISVMLVGYMGAIAGFHVLKTILSKKTLPE